MPQVSLDPGKLQFLPDMLLILHPQNFVAWKSQKHKNGLLGNFELISSKPGTKFSSEACQNSGGVFFLREMYGNFGKATYVKS